MEKFSIITVCMNAEKEIGDTIASVLNQTYTNFEYIIKDGESKDNTLRFAESFISAFHQKGIPYRIICKADSGIYDAMNQATREAQGEWVNYMNAGDWFADSSVLEQVANSECLRTADVVYGDKVLRNGDLYCYRKPCELEMIRERLPFRHQSAFTRRELLVQMPYALEYRVCSDFHFYLKLYRREHQFAYIPIAVCIYDTHGISSQWEKNLGDRIRILEEMPERDDAAILMLQEQVKKKKRSEWLYQHFFRFIPKKLRLMRRKLMNRKSDWKPAEEVFLQRKDYP